MMLVISLLTLSLCQTIGSSYNGLDAGKRQYRIQNGPCSYTFLLPEQDNCQGSYNDPVQRDGPEDITESFQRLQQLESTMENNTQWLLKLENYIQDSLKHDMVQMQQTAVQNHTATMIEIGASLLSQTVEQSKKLTNVETQVISQTTRLEKKLLENALSTNKLEKQVIVQSNEISKLSDKNSYLEKRVEEMEGQRLVELKTLREEKQQLEALLLRQTAVIGQLQQQLLKVSSNNTALHNQQQQLLDSVNSLIQSITVGTFTESKTAMMKDLPTTHVDCAAVFKSGNTESGVYSLTFPDSMEVKVFCDMETDGGGWTVIQKRFDGHVDFHRTWQEYKKVSANSFRRKVNPWIYFSPQLRETSEKEGFGEPSGEYWLGNDFVYKLTNAHSYKLRIQLNDWEGNSGFSQYDQFLLESEAQNFRIQLKGYSGTAGKISSIGQPGSEFSTKDADNDKCVCKCSQLTTGGWWFDACGPSNLNGMYYQQGQNSNRFNGIKWYYWKGSGYSLKTTTMMIRPADFSSSL